MDTMMLPVELTESELAYMGRGMGAMSQSLEREEMAKKEAMKAHDAAIQTFKRRLADMSKMLAEGVEYREVPVTETKDYEAGVVIITRDDTHKEVTRRPMNTADRQEQLPLDPRPEPTDSRADIRSKISEALTELLKKKYGHLYDPGTDFRDDVNKFLHDASVIELPGGGTRWLTEEDIFLRNVSMYDLFSTYERLCKV